MIESLKDLELEKLNREDKDYLEQVSNIFKEKLGVDFNDVKMPLIDYVKSHAEELSLSFPNIAPYGDYSKLIEDNDGMADFLKSLEKVDDWKVLSVDEDRKYNLLKFSFASIAVDDGESLEGFTYVSKDGKIKHSFAQYSG